MRYQSYAFAALWLSACVLPHLERREGAANDSTPGGADSAGQAGSSSQHAGAGNTQSSGLAGSSDAGAPGADTGTDSGGGNQSGSAGKGGAPAGSGAGGAGPTSGGTSAGGEGGSSGNAGGGGSAGCATKNACGGCATLTAAVGDVCAGCGNYACNGFEKVTCESSCAAPKAACNTTSNQCVACLVDADCAAGTPVCSATNTCLVCKPSSSGCAGTTPTSCNAAGTVLSNGTVHSGTCGATCDPGVLRCTNLIGQKCSADGTAYISSGSNVQCGCTDSGGRFRFTADNKVKDSTTGLTWDFPEHAATTNAAASTACAAKGMRLPTQLELGGLLLAAGPTMACSQKLYLAIDSVAFPGIVATTRYWTGEPEGGFPGYYYVVYFYGPSSQTGSSGYGTTDRTSSDMVPYQCVQ